MAKLDYLTELTDAQRTAVTSGDGVSVVLAVPGAGKTRVITYRIAHLIQQEQVDPANIVAITFTNKAANEMKSRVSNMLSKAAVSRLMVSTFHSLCAKVLRVQHEAAGIGKNYTICDDSDTEAYIIQAIALETHEDPKKVKGWKDERSPDKVAKFITLAKQHVMRTEDILDELQADTPPSDVFYAQVYSRYQTILRKSNSLDFDDLIMRTVLLFRENEDVRNKYASAVRYLLVDEYQDTNPSQYELVRHLVSVHENLMVVGDVNQSIYGWRGAKPKHLSQVTKDYPGATTFLLEDNFRSTQPIADVANLLINHNSENGKSPVTIRPVVQGGDPVRCVELLDPRQEAAVIVDEILTAVKSGNATWKDFAILYRMHSRSRVFEELMVAHNVPHRIIGGVGFYNRAVVKDLLAYVKLLANGADEASFIRIYNKPPRGFGDTSYAKIYQLKEQLDIPIVDMFKKRHYSEVLKGKAEQGAEQIRDTLKTLYQMPKDKVAPLIQTASEVSGYAKMLRADGKVESVDRLDHIDELVEAAQEFDERHGGGLIRFLEWTSLMQATDNQDDEDRVQLMTCHAAKGLEFKNLYVIGAIDGVMPIVRDADEFGRPKTMKQMEEDVEEERRVFFVALTRAERRLTVTYVRQQLRYNSVVECMKSRFLTEIESAVEQEFLADTNAGSYLMAAIGKKKNKGYQKNRRPNNQRGRY